LIVFPILPAEGPPPELDGLESAGHGLLQLVAEPARLVEKEGAVRLDPVSVASAQQSGHRLPAELAEEGPPGDVDPADRMFDRAATALPEVALTELLRNAGRFVRPLAKQQGA